MKTLLSISILSVLSLAGEIFGFRRLVQPIVLIGLLVALVFNLSDWNTNASYFNNMMLFDNFAVGFSALLISTALLLFLVLPKFYETWQINKQESYALQLFALAGGICMISFGNLSMLFIGIELMSISSYVLAGSDKRNLLSNEAALKYFLMGSFASGFLLFGIALVYGATGTFDLAAIGKYALVNQETASPMFYGGIALLIIAMGFKASIAPFHFWAPDVYDGSPTGVTAFMATIVKIAAFAAFVRLFSYGFAPLNANLSLLLAVMAALTMSIGNLSALWQDSFKRMLAFSGVAHAGYLLLGLVSSAGLAASNAVLFYGTAYALSSIVAFAVLLLIDYQLGHEGRKDFKGLSRKHPLLAAAVTVAMLSLAGIPPTAGFFGKYYLFSLAINAGYSWLVFIAVVNSVISVFYYFDIIIKMYAPDNQQGLSLDIPMPYKIALGVATFGTLALGIWPALLAGIL